MTSVPAISPGKSWVRCVLLVGLLVGVADYAIGFGLFVAMLGAPVLRVLQHPASGLMGPAAYQGGINTAILGTVMHFVIALGWAAVFAAAYRASPRLRRASATTGRAFFVAAVMGVAVWVLMNSVVLTLSRGRPYAVDSGLFWAILALHIPFVGAPLVWGTRRWAPAARATESRVLPSLRGDLWLN